MQDAPDPRQHPLQREVSDEFLHVPHLATQVLHLAGVRLARRVTGQALLAGFWSGPLGPDSFRRPI